VRFLPPLLIVLAGAAFLAYRSQADDWRGLSAFDPRWWSWSGQHATSKPGPDLALKTAPEPTPAPAPVKPEAPAAPKVEEPPSPAVASAEKPEKPKPEADPGDDIEREAARTRERIAELEKMKQQEADRLAATEDQRRQEERLTRRDRMPRFQGINPGDLDKLLQAQHAQLARQMAQMVEVQRRLMERLDELDRQFFGRGMGRGVPGAGSPFPPGFGMVAPPDFVDRFNFTPEGIRRAPVPPPPGPGPGMDNGNANGNGNARNNAARSRAPQIRQFRGPGGVTGFEMRWSNVPDDRSDVPPPPPQPAARGRGLRVPQGID
jgi:hypothetical protein